jgi:hypothetical protein
MRLTLPYSIFSAIVPVNKVAADCSTTPNILKISEEISSEVLDAEDKSSSP